MLTGHPSPDKGVLHYLRTIRRTRYARLPRRASRASGCGTSASLNATERDVPGQAGAALAGGPQLHAPAQALGPLAEVLEAEPGRVGVADADPVVGDHQAQLLAGGDRDHHLRGPGMLPDVGQCLPEHGEHLLCQRIADGGVHGATERTLRKNAEHRAQLVDEVEDLRVQALLVDGELYVEDRLAELPDRLVELVDRLPDPHHGLRALDQAGGPLQRQADGEQALDHRIMEVAGDPVAV